MANRTPYRGKSPRIVHAAAAYSLPGAALPVCVCVGRLPTIVLVRTVAVEPVPLNKPPPSPSAPAPSAPSGASGSSDAAEPHSEQEGNFFCFSRRGQRKLADGNIKPPWPAPPIPPAVLAVWAVPARAAGLYNPIDGLLLAALLATMSNCHLALNEAAGGIGGAGGSGGTGSAGGDGEGGGIFNGTGSTATVRTSTIVGNQAYAPRAAVQRRPGNRRRLSVQFGKFFLDAASINRRELSASTSNDNVYGPITPI